MFWKSFVTLLYKFEFHIIIVIYHINIQMKKKILFSVFFLIGCYYATSSQNLSEKEMITKAYQLVKENHSGEKPANYVVKVVYFHGKDQAPLANWKERLTTVLDDVSNFYGEEFHKYGIDIKGIPFEKSYGEYVFHVVQGDLDARSYNTQSGSVIQQEIARKAKEQINFSTDHVLIINGLCYQRDDSVYVFHSPYYGTSSFIMNGLCMVADCELLDSRLLKDTVQRMKFSEMMVELKECSVAEFNSWYIGGIAHEMGHLFGIPHDYGHLGEIPENRISLMGEHGSRHFRDYLWGGTPSAVFSTAGILQLISHPLFTQFNKPQNTNLDFGMSGMQFGKNDAGMMQLKIKLKAKDLPYGVVALMRPAQFSEYFNRSFSNIIQGTDSVNLELQKLSTGNYNLQLIFLFPNGVTRWFNNIIVNVDTDGNTEVIKTLDSRVDIRKLYEKLEKQEKTPQIQTKLEILKGILNPVTPIDPAKCPDNKLYLSDAQWEKAVVGWEEPARNYFTYEAEYKFFLELQGKLYSKGIYAHSSSSYVFNLNKQWKKFSAIVGIRDYAHPQGSARFTIIGDGKVLYQSKVLRVNQQEIVNTDISNVKTLELKADGTEGHNYNSWAIWVNPVVEK